MIKERAHKSDGPEDQMQNLLLSEYSLATSATASPILFLTVLVFSAPNASRSFCRIAYACSCGIDRNSSTLSPDATLRVFDAILRNITAANERVCRYYISDHISIPTPLPVYPQNRRDHAHLILTVVSFEP
jgi:hypothetical protein